jgi:hypothetical protein
VEREKRLEQQRERRHNMDPEEREKHLERKRKQEKERYQNMDRIQREKHLEQQRERRQNKAQVNTCRVNLLISHTS